MAKYYIYVDETGRDRFSKNFIVGVLVTSRTRQALGDHLLALEKSSRKNKSKWHGANWRYRPKRRSGHSLL